MKYSHLGGVGACSPKNLVQVYINATTDTFVVDKHICVFGNAVKSSGVKWYLWVGAIPASK